MSAIETCRTAVMGGHVEACTDCGHWRVAYNSCRNRHCPRCQGAAARTWLAEREADLLPVGYFHVVFTLPAEIADIALQNKAAVYGLLFPGRVETMTTIAADPKHLGARIGITAVLHTWGSAMTHHPHIHMIVPGGGLSPDGSRWVSSRPGVPLAGARAGQAVPPPVPHSADGAAQGRAARLLRQPRAPRRPPRLPAPPGTGQEEELGRLRQAAVRRARDGARLSVALHPSGRDLEQPPPALRRYRRHVPLQELPLRWRRPAADHRRSPPTSSSAASCFTSCRRASTASVTTACSPAPPARSCSTTSASCSGWRRPPPSTRRPSPTTSVRHAHAAAGTWSSSRTFERSCRPRAPPHGVHPDRGHHVMTRHGSTSSCRAASALPAMMPLAPTMPPPAPTSISCSRSGQHLHPILTLTATSSTADTYADSRRARLTTGPNPKTP